MAILQFEGTDGTGKTYLSTQLYDYLRSERWKVLYQHYPSNDVKYKIVNRLYPSGFMKDLECIWEIYNTRKNHYWKYDIVIEDRGYLSTLIYGDKDSEEMVKGLIKQHEWNTTLIYLDYIYDEDKEENHLDVHKHQYRKRYREVLEDIQGYKRIIKIDYPIDVEGLIGLLGEELK